MNRSYSKIRHIQESNKRLEKRFLNEVGDPSTWGKPLPFDVSEKDLEKVKDFFDTMPKLKKHMDFSCKKCGYTENIELEGLQSFFV